MARLILVFNKQVIRDCPFAKESIAIGRSEENDIVIDNLAVSGFHARIDRIGDTYILTDLQSTNGTFVNDKKIVSHKLQHRDKIMIGKHFLFFAMSKAEQTKSEEDAELDQTMILDTAKQKELLAKQAQEKAIDAAATKERIGVISFIDRSDQGEIKLNKKLTKIGKAETSEIRLGGLFMSPTAATISRRPNGYAITSTGGAKVKVNNQAIQDSQYLNDFDTIEVGSYKFQFYTQDVEDEK